MLLAILAHAKWSRGDNVVNSYTRQESENTQNLIFLHVVEMCGSVNLMGRK